MSSSERVPTLRNITPTVSNIRPITAGRRQLTDLLTEWSQRYPNLNTRKQYYDYADKLFLFAGTTNPEALNEAHIANWATEGNIANNSVRARLMAARALLTWCSRNGYQIRDMDLSHVRKAHPRTSGIYRLPSPHASYQRRTPPPAHYLQRRHMAGQQRPVDNPSRHPQHAPVRNSWPTVGRHQWQPDQMDR